MAPRKAKRTSKAKKRGARRKSKRAAKRAKPTPRKAKRIAKKPKRAVRKKKVGSNDTGLFIVIVDADKNTYSVEGPVKDITKWQAAVNSAANLGRQVGLMQYEVTGSTVTRQMALASAANSNPGRQLVPSGSIVHL